MISAWDALEHPSEVSDMILASPLASAFFCRSGKQSFIDSTYANSY
jgi:hypothetical protein